MTILCDGRSVELTPKEFGLFKLLYSSPGTVFSREDIAKIVWDGIVTRVVDVYVGYLRKKLGYKSIVSVRGFGYSIKSIERYKMIETKPTSEPVSIG